MNRWVCGGVLVLVAVSAAGAQNARVQQQVQLLITELDSRGPREIPNPFGGGGVVVPAMPVAQKLRILPPGAPPQEIPQSPSRQRPIRPAPVPAGPPKFDRHGDPLPAGAVARYGTVRLRHGPEPIGLGFSPDGKVLGSISTTDDGIRLWEPDTGKEVHRLNTPVTLAAFARDGSILVVDENRCKQWIPAGNIIRDLPENALPENVQSLAVHPDCRSFVVGVPQKVVQIDLRTGKPMREFRCAIEQFPTRLVFSPDGRWLAGSGQKSGVWLWDLKTGKRVRTYRSEFDFPEYGFSADGSRIVIAGEQLRVYPTDSEEVADEYKPPEGVFLAPRFSADGKWVYAISNDGDVIQVNAATGEAKDPWETPDMALRAPMAISPDGALAAAVDQTGGIRIWDPRTGKGPEAERLPLLEGPGFSADGKTVWCLAADSKIHGFDAGTGKPGKVIDLPVDESTPVFWDPTTRRAVALIGGDQFELQVIDVDAAKVVGKFTVPQMGGVPLVAFCPTDRNRAAVFGQGSVVVVNLATGKPIRSFNLGKMEETPPSHGAISPDGRLVAIATPGRALSVWEASTGKKRFELDSFQNPEGAAFSADGRLLAVWNTAGNVAVFDVRLGSVVRRVESASPDPSNNTVAFSLDGKRLAVGERDGSVTVWDIASGDPLVTLDRHDGFVTGLAFSRDGKRLASTAQDGTVLVWEIPDKAPPAAPGLTVGGFDEAFRLLGSSDASNAQRGMEYLYRRPAEAVKQCAERITQKAGTPVERITKLIGDLASEDFPVRQAALKTLEAVGGEAAAELRQAAEKSGSPEVRKLAGEALTKIEASAPSADDLRGLRAVEVLENIGTAEARALLTRWAAGPAGQRLTSEATAALARLKARGN
jgi:WD40 repeat protein